MVGRRVRRRDLSDFNSVERSTNDCDCIVDCFSSIYERKDEQGNEERCDKRTLGKPCTTWSTFSVTPLAQISRLRSASRDSSTAVRRWINS